MPDDTGDSFTVFVRTHEQRLRRALVATYGPTVGRDATVDALSWAWEHWDRVVSFDNPVGYLYRVGQTAAGRHLTQRGRAMPVEPSVDAPDITPELEPALARLSQQQRAVVVLVHGYGMSQREVADVLGVGVSTAREHLHRAMARLRDELGHEVEEVRDVR
ncbi:MAG: sigma-70 family RNA polymerase sigma factor [Acidimicrobiales bacterium]